MVWNANKEIANTIRREKDWKICSGGRESVFGTEKDDNGTGVSGSLEGDWWT